MIDLIVNDLVIITIIVCCAAAMAFLHYVYNKGYFTISLILGGVILIVGDIAGICLWSSSYCVDYTDKISACAIVMFALSIIYAAIGVPYFLHVRKSEANVIELN